MSIVIKLLKVCTLIALVSKALLHWNHNARELLAIHCAVSKSGRGSQRDAVEGRQEKRRQRICRVNSLSARWFAQRMFMGCVRWSINHPFDFTLSCVCFTPVSATGYGASILSI
jgi:hypothetical protein